MGLLCYVGCVGIGFDVWMFDCFVVILCKYECDMMLFDVLLCECMCMCVYWVELMFVVECEFVEWIGDGIVW